MLHWPDARCVRLTLKPTDKGKSHNQRVLSVGMLTKVHMLFMAWNISLCVRPSKSLVGLYF